MSEYCQCARWKRFRHIVSEHAEFERRAPMLTPRQWARETHEPDVSPDASLANCNTLTLAEFARNLLWTQRLLERENDLPDSDTARTVLALLRRLPPQAVAYGMQMLNHDAS